MENLVKRIYVSGTVQGVGFRYFTEGVARRLGIAGYVKNTRDGRVEVYAIGSATQLDSLEEQLRRGPRMATVREVTKADADVLPGFAHSFSIEPDD